MSAKGLYIDVMTGNVGIGTKTPLYPLHVDGDIRVQQNLIVSTNIGIGTTIPKTTLDVSGILSASNFIGDFAGDINGVSAAAISLSTARTIAGNTYSGSNTLTFPSLTQSGNRIQGDAYNFSTSRTWSISNVFTSNVPNSIVARDANGDFGTGLIYTFGNIGIGTTLPKQAIHLTSNNHMNISSNVTLYLNNTAPTLNQYLITSGTAVSWNTLTATSSSNYIFTSGINQSVTIGSNVKYVVLAMWGAGGGGGGGITNATCSGGAGGSSGQYLRFVVPNMTSANNNMIIKYTIGTGGTSGTTGGTGGIGGNTTIEITSNVLVAGNVYATAYGGNGGGAGQAGATSTGGAAITAITNTYLYRKIGDSLVGASGTSGAIGSAGTTASTNWGAGSGASGGGVSGTTAYNGGVGGNAIIFGGTVTGGTAGIGTTSGTGTAGGNGTSYTSGSLIVSATGGGGGGNGTTGGGNGGNGGTPAGGAGGGGSTSSGTAGTGGTGGNGLLILECH